MNIKRAQFFPEKDFESYLFCLTHRELEVMVELSNDLTNKEIADKLCITGKSVANYRNRIASKLNIHGPHLVARFARANKIKLKEWYITIKNESKK